MKLQRSILLMILFCIGIPLCAQQWVARFSAGSNVTIETAGIVKSGSQRIVAGSAFTSSSDWDVVTVAIDASGDTVWTYTYDNGYDEKAVDVAVDPASGTIYVLASVWDNSGFWTERLLILDQNGGLTSDAITRPSGSRSAIAVGGMSRADDGRIIIIVMKSGGSDAAVMDSLLVYSVTPPSTIDWVHSIAGSGVPAMSAFGNNVLIAGWKSDGSGDAMYELLDKDGNVSVDGTYSGGGSEYRFTKAVLTSSRMYLAGMEYVSDSDSRPIILVFLLSNQQDWMFTPTGLPTGRHRIMDMAVNDAGEVVATMRVETSPGDFDILTQQIQTGGTAGWSDTFSGTGKSGDDTPPLFAGVSSGLTLSDTKVSLTWQPAADEQSLRDEMMYDVFAATSSGTQDFSTPTISTSETWVEVDGLTAETDYFFVVRARDYDDNADDNTREISIATAKAGLTILTDNLLAARICEFYFVNLQASSGQTPYTWTVVSGTLPPDFDLDTDGRLHGTTQEPGSYTFTVQVTDDAAKTATKEFTLVVEPGEILIVDSDLTLPGGNYCYTSVYVNTGATLTYTGPTKMHISDSVVVDGTLLLDCHELEMTGYKVLRVTGVLDNRCVTADSTTGGSLLFNSPEGAVELAGGTPDQGIYSHGDFALMDDPEFELWEFAIPPEARSATTVDPVTSLSANILNTQMRSGDTVEVEFMCSGLDPDGGKVTFELKFGNGDVMQGIQPEDGETAFVLKEYYTPGTYRVTLTTRDDEMKVSVSEIQLFIGDSLSYGNDGIGLAGDAGTLLVPVNDTLYLTPQLGLGSSAELDTILWIPEGTPIPGENLAYAYSTPGRYDISCWAQDDSGNATSVTFSVWVYTPDTTAGGEPPSSVAPQPPMIIDMPILVRRKIVFHGHRDLIVNPGGILITRNGANGTDNRSGGRGAGLRTWSAGTLRINGGMFLAGNGGNGGMPSGPGARGKAGGRGGSLTFYGRNIVVNGGSFSAGDGGKGSDQVKFKAPSGTAWATGGPGGHAGKRVRFQGRSVSFTGPTSIHLGNGGDGGSATATGGSGNSKCTVGQDGANGRARGGRGGKANKRGSGWGNVSGRTNISITGGQGGKGGDATATGGKGGDATGCRNTATGGKGGYATALGGNGGKSGYSGAAFAGAMSFKPGNGGNAIANPGDGGRADAVPFPAKGAAGCPGEDGVNVTARGGQGGRGTSENGRKGKKIGVGIDADPGTSTVNGSDGGSASSTGGAGGDAIDQCSCDGGNGGSATSNGGLRGPSYARSLGGGQATANKGNDGNASATGGEGGTGGDCCTPPGPSGGTGGNGGDADATAGPNGSIYSATGGAGGDGGDGFGPGAGGKGGTATGTGASGQATDGDDGDNGEWCFPNYMWFFCHFTPIPDGPLTPGSSVGLPACADRDPNGLLANVDLYLMTTTEVGAPVDYSKLGDKITINTGGLELRLTTFTDVHVPTRQWKCEKFTLGFNTPGGMAGVCAILGYSGPLLIAQKEVMIDPLVNQYQEMIEAPPGESFDKIVIYAESPIIIPIWGISGYINTP